MKLKNYKTIGSLATVTDGEHGSPDLDENSGIMYLSGNNVKDNVIDFENIRYCSLKLHQKNLRSELQKNSVLMSIVGTIGKASVVYYDVLANTDRNVATIKNISSELNSYFLSTFLNSKFGYFQTQRFSTGNVQPLLNLQQVRSIVVPIFSELFQVEIEKLVKNAHSELEKSKATYSQSENLLLNALGMADFSPSTKNTSEKSFKDSFLATGRLDAEYYQPKYEEIEKICFENAEYTKRIKDIQLWNGRGLQPDYVENGELNVINSRHILERELDYKNFEKTSLDNWGTQIRARIYRNDILTYTTGANIGRTQVYLSDEKSLASNHVNILRIENENPIYVAFVLNSKIGRLQTEQLSAGSAQQELYPKDIDNFYVPFIKKEIQNQIADLIQQSFSLKAESENLLETAKRAVEIAIETDEQTAIESLQN